MCLLRSAWISLVNIKFITTTRLLRRQPRVHHLANESFREGHERIRIWYLRVPPTETATKSHTGQVDVSAGNVCSSLRPRVRRTDEKLIKFFPCLLYSIRHLCPLVYEYYERAIRFHFLPFSPVRSTMKTEQMFYYCFNMPPFGKFSSLLHVCKDLKSIFSVSKHKYKTFYEFYKNKIDSEVNLDQLVWVYFNFYRNARKSS